MSPFKFNSEEEKEFVEWYKREEEHKYAKPSVTADIAIFSMTEEAAGSQKKQEEQKLKLLLIKRGGHPCKDMFALPGGFANPDETVDQAAERELKEETGLDCNFLEQVRFFSDPGRDPRTWTMTCCFLSLVDASQCKVQAGDDAKEAKWFEVTMEKISKKKIFPEKPSVENISIDNEEKDYWNLELKCGEIKLHAVLEETKEKRIYPRLKMIESENIAFDHGLIIGYAVLQLREWMKEKKL